MSTLSHLKEHAKFTVNVSGYQVQKTLFNKLISIGLFPGKTFQVIHKNTNGFIVVANKNLKIAVDKYTAQTIRVTLIK